MMSGFPAVSLTCENGSVLYGAPNPDTSTISMSIQKNAGAVPLTPYLMRSKARERGWLVVRWTTADDNYRARAKYDQVATRTNWITYDMTPQDVGSVVQDDQF
jgi:hypothetical protein